MINTIQQNDIDVVRMFYSQAEERKGNIRIHYHTMLELSMILQGKGTYQTHDRIYQIQQGDIFFYRPNESHCISDIEYPHMTLLNLHISPLYLHTNFPVLLQTGCLYMLSSNFKLASNKINDFLSEKQVEVIKSYMLSIRDEMAEAQSNYNIAVNAYLSLILVQLERILQPTYQKESNELNINRIWTAVEYIDLHFRERISLAEIAEKVGYSRCHFSTMFRKFMGMSPWDYVSIKRIEESLTMIRTTDLSILEIAYACGFNNSANFNRTFKKFTNLLPSSFRS